VARLAAPLGGSTLPSGTAPVLYLHQGFGPGTTLITGQDGQAAEERLFEPFGANLLASADYALEPHGWNAKPMDPHREWSDHGARWHATPLGRWTAADPPLRHPAGLLDHGLNASTYGFVAGNPVGFWDPDGRDPNVFGLLGQVADAKCHRHAWSG
jgi:RHS repeat-associated protein